MNFLYEKIMNGGDKRQLETFNKLTSQQLNIFDIKREKDENPFEKQ